MRKYGKQLLGTILAGLLCLVLLPGLSVAKTDESMRFAFELSSEGKESIQAFVGDEISFELRLKRVDSGKKGHYTLYSIQDEIIFDSRHFTFVDGSQVVASGFDFSLRTLEDGFRKRIIISRLVMSPAGVSMPDETLIVEFRLRANEAVQGERITSRNFKINNQKAESYHATSNDVVVAIQGDEPARYAVFFEGGPDASGLPPSVGAQLAGDSFQLPVNRFRKDGFQFFGWYDGTNTYQEGASYTMPARVVTFTALWKEQAQTSLPAETTHITVSTETPPIEDSTATTTSPVNLPSESMQSTTNPESIEPVTSISEPVSNVTTGGLPVEIKPSDDKAKIDLIISPKDQAGREINIEKSDGDILLTGRDLSGLRVEVVKPGGKWEIILDTEETKVLIKVVDKDAVEVFVDRDGDGSFETSIGKYILKSPKRDILLVSLAVLLAALVILFVYRKKRSPKEG